MALLNNETLGGCPKSLLRGRELEVKVDVEVVGAAGGLARHRKAPEVSVSSQRAELTESFDQPAEQERAERKMLGS